MFLKICFKLKTLFKFIIKQILKMYLIVYNIFSEGKTFSLKVFYKNYLSNIFLLKSINKFSILQIILKILKNIFKILSNT